MASETNYGDTAAAGWANIPEVKVLPDGTYELELAAIFYSPPGLSKKGTELSAQFRPLYKAVAFGGDVDSRARAALGEGYDLSINDDIGGGTFWWSSLREKGAFLQHLAMHKGVDLDALSKLPLTVDGERKGEKTQVINPEVMKQLRGARIRGKVTQDTYEGKTRNVASDFTPSKS